MAELRVRAIDEADIDSVLAEDFDFEGQLHVEKDVLVKGKFKGEISAGGNVYLSEQASVDSRTNAVIVSIRGEHTGAVRARERVDVYSSGYVAGTIESPDLIVQSGARLACQCTVEASKST